jgi:hypothetical protein
MKRLLLYALIVSALLSAGVAKVYAQDWKNVLQLKGTIGASAFFFNGHEGMIGTGNYLNATPAQIYYTNDGGSSWKLAQFANPNIRGQVTDIYFRDRLYGWATIREYTETGWTGVYRSTNGGETWARMKQAGFPVGIRETSRGVFYTDRDINAGVMFSSDTGKTWTHIATTIQALGIDFMDDTTGFVTTQATSALCPYLLTTNGGKTWQSITTSSEAWTPYGDPFSRSFFVTSERDPLIFTTQTAILKVSLASLSAFKIKSYSDSALTGGIAGSHVCQSIIYVQGRLPASFAPDGIIRTMDAGVTWNFVGGPSNINDKRFAVTGRGAVVFAFDDSGNVFRTADGGDGTLSPSVLPSVTIALPLDTVRTTLCDSVIIPIALGYHLCDSAQIASVIFPNDSLGELSAPLYDNDFKYFSTSRSDTLKIVYRPAKSQTRNVSVTITLRQPDGYSEDTTLHIMLEAVPSKTNALVVSGTTVHDTLNFDSVSICSDAYRSIMVSDLGCDDLSVDSIVASGATFSLVSHVRPFILSPGNSRTFLIHYTPGGVGASIGAIYIAHKNIVDSITLLGVGYSSGDAVSLIVSDSIHSSECDSAQFTVTLRNIACKAFKFDSITTNPPFRVGSIPSLDSVQTDGTATFPFTFIPNKTGSDTGTIHLAVSYAGTGFYDTIITVVGIGTSGKPSFRTSNASLDMKMVPICSDAVDSLVIYSSGCAGVSVSAAFDSTNGFSITRAPKPTLASPDSDKVVLAFHPNNSLGKKTANLIFTTSAGNDTIPVSITVVPGGGTIAYHVTPNIQAYTCQSQPFSITVADSLCDAITIDKITLGGPNSEDFSLSSSLPFTLNPKGQTTFNGIFSPQDSLTRSDSVTFTIHEADGTPHDTTIGISGQGISIPPIQVALGVTQVTAGEGQTVTIPVTAKRGSMANMSTFECTLLMNTDLLTPLASNTNGYFGTITPTISTSRAAGGSKMDTVHIQFQRGADAVLPTGELCELVCEAYVTSVTSTGIALHEVQFHDGNGSSQCLASETVPDTSAVFILNKACGDTTIAHLFATGTLVLDGISPNPTSGRVRLTFHVPTSYTNDALLEIYNPLGEKLGERQIAFPEGATGKQTFDLDLNGESIKANEGILYLRIQTRSGPITAKVVVLSEP